MNLYTEIILLDICMPKACLPWRPLRGLAYLCQDEQVYSWKNDIITFSYFQPAHFYHYFEQNYCLLLGIMFYICRQISASLITSVILAITCYNVPVFSPLTVLVIGYQLSVIRPKSPGFSLACLRLIGLQTGYRQLFSYCQQYNSILQYVCRFQPSVPATSWPADQLSILSVYMLLFHNKPLMIKV